MAESVVPNLVESEDRSLRDFSSNIVTELAVHRLPDGVIVLEDEAEARHAGRGDVGCKNERRQIEELNAAAAYLRQQIGIGAELICGKQLDIDSTRRRFANAVQRFLRTNIDGMSGIMARRI